MFNPKNPKLTDLSLGHQVGKAMQPLLANDRKMTSVGKFFKAVKSKIMSDNAMQEKMAKITTLRAAVGTDLGLPEKKQKIFFEEAGKTKVDNRNLLSQKYLHQGQFKASQAMHDYQHGVEAHDPYKDKKTEAIKLADSPTAHQGQGDEKEQAGHHLNPHDAHNRMQKIRDEIERQKKEHQDHEVSATQKIRANDRGGASGSIAHMGANKPEEKAVDPHLTHLGGGARQAGASGSISQLLDKKPVNDNVEEGVSFGGPIAVANDNVEIPEAVNDNLEVPEAANDNKEDNVPEAKIAA